MMQEQISFVRDALKDAAEVIGQMRRAQLDTAESTSTLVGKSQRASARRAVKVLDDVGQLFSRAELKLTELS